MAPLLSLAGVPVGRRRTAGLVSLGRLSDTNAATRRARGLYGSLTLTTINWVLLRISILFITVKICILIMYAVQCLAKIVLNLAVLELGLTNSACGNSREQFLLYTLIVCDNKRE